MTPLRCRQCDATEPASFYPSQVALGGSWLCRVCHRDYERDRYHVDLVLHWERSVARRRRQLTDDRYVEANRARAQRWRDRKRAERLAREEGTA